jgi:hypothetical protein
VRGGEQNSLEKVSRETSRKNYGKLAKKFSKDFKNTGKAFLYFVPPRGRKFGAQTFHTVCHVSGTKRIGIKRIAA